MPPTTTKKGKGTGTGAGAGAGVGSEELRKVRDRELELKRMSGEISCWDCRRLKLKCDKKIPCSSCVRRGAGSLCPLGAGASSSQNSRLVVAGPSSDSQRTKRKLAVLSERIRALEDALHLESGSYSGSGGAPPHPLLTNEMLAIKQCVDDDEDEYYQEEEESDHLLSAFGTLTIGEGRTMRYLGPAASESVFLMEALETSAPSHPSITASSRSLPSELIQTSKAFPFTPLHLSQDDDSLLAQLVTYLPPFERATALYEAFFANLSWFVAPIERSHVVSEIVPLFYPRRRPIVPALVRGEHAHDLALLFIVLACGSVGDLTQSPINDEAEQYHTLTKVALCVKSVMHGASLSGVQTLFLLGSYDVYCGRKSNQEDAWKLAMVGNSMAASIGLHRDPSRWGLEQKLVDRRRKVFWEIYLIDTWKSLHTGRPSVFRPNVVDCEFPNDCYATLGEDGEVIESVWQWRYRFLRSVLTDVCEKVCSARPLKYRDVLELDRRIRDFAVHPFALRHQPDGDDLGVDSEFRRLHPLITAWDKEESLMYIHRNFFARAILDYPDNPMYSPFAASFLATYRSASAILRICRESINYMYLTVLRVWEIWSLCLSCGVIVGAVASLGSSINFATSAFVELEYTISLFERFSEHRVAKHGLPLLQRIRERAVRILHKPRVHRPASTDAAEQLARVPTIRSAGDAVNEELLILRGTTRVVEQRSAPASRVHTATASPGDTPPSDTNNSSKGAAPTDFHSANPSTESNIGAHFLENVNVTQSGQSVFIEEIPDHPLLDADGVQNANASQLHELYPWLAELEQIQGTAVDTQQPHPTANQQHHKDQFQWLNAFSGPSTSLPSLSSAPSTHASSNLPPVPSHDGLPGTALPEVFLDETVSTEAWRVFMQQSGFSDSPPFDFGLDSVGPTTNTSHDWQGEAAMST